MKLWEHPGCGVVGPVEANALLLAGLSILNLLVLVDSGERRADGQALHVRTTPLEMTVLTTPSKPRVTSQVRPALVSGKEESA